MNVLDDLGGPHSTYAVRRQIPQLCDEHCVAEGCSGADRRIRFRQANRGSLAGLMVIEHRYDDGRWVEDVFFHAGCYTAPTGVELLDRTPLRAATR